MFYGKFDSEDRKRRFKELLEVLRPTFGKVFAMDNLIALGKSAGFTADRRFMEAVEAQATSKQNRTLLWRLHTLVWAAQHALAVPGDFVECGVWRGFSFGVVVSYLDFSAVPKTLHLYDTFHGIPDAYNSESRPNTLYERENSEDPDAILKHVRKVFEPYPNVRIAPGIVPEVFESEFPPPESISLLHIDMNSAASEMAALEHLYDRVSPGGMIVFDDYGWHAYRAQKDAEDAFMAERGHHVLELPTGQGLVVKHG